MSKPLTSPANLQAKGLASKLVMVSMPVLPANKLAQQSATVFPTGAMQPSPVTTTRRLVMPANLSGNVGTVSGRAGCKSAPEGPDSRQRGLSGLLILGS